MAGMFEHTFQHVLFGVGAFLALVGAIFAIANGPSAEGLGMAELISYGFASFFLALFSGSLIGVGATMAADALILGLRGNKAHMAACSLFSLLSLFIAASSIAQADASSFHMLTLFFAGLSAAGAFMISAALFGLSALFHSFITKAQAAGQLPAASARQDGKASGAPQKPSRWQGAKSA